MVVLSWSVDWCFRVQVSAGGLRQSSVKRLWMHKVKVNILPKTWVVDKSPPQLILLIFVTFYEIAFPFSDKS